MLDRLFGPKKKRDPEDVLSELGYRMGRRIKEVQIPYFGQRVAELRKRIAEKQTSADGQ